MKDKTLICSDCGQEFVWTEGEQKFYLEKGLNQPKFCPICRGKRQAEEKFKQNWNSNNHE
jgi:ribosomal protein L33